MQRLLIIIAFLFCAPTAKADCAGNGIWCWPNSATLKANPIIVISFYAESQQIARGLNTKYAIYLKSGNQKIKLLPVEICVGQFWITQAIVKPATGLTAGLEYQLVIDSLPKYETLQKWNKETFKYEAPKWKVLKDADTEFPAWIKLPTFNSKSIVHFGCGPSISVLFDYQAADASEMLVKTIVKNTKTGHFTTYYIDAPDKKISVGHDMCSGAFDFEPDIIYEASFSLMDASGNFSCLGTAPYKFTKPTDKHK